MTELCPTQVLTDLSETRREHGEADIKEAKAADVSLTLEVSLFSRDKADTS